MAKMKLVSMLVKKEKELKKAYNEAIETESVKFDFEGQVFYTAYAKHVLDYINNYKKLLKNGQDNTTRQL
jgi:hypothetical protein